MILLLGDVTAALVSVSTHNDKIVRSHTHQNVPRTWVLNSALLSSFPALSHTEVLFVFHKTVWPSGVRSGDHLAEGCAEAFAPDLEW
jgi:hypothetical protein